MIPRVRESRLTWLTMLPPNTCRAFKLPFSLYENYYRGLQFVDPVQLHYKFNPKSIYPHWIEMVERTFNADYYGDMFRTRHPYSERHKWLLDNIGLGGYHSSQYPDQKWFAYESKESPVVCFLNEKDAVLFKMWWG